MSDYFYIYIMTNQHNTVLYTGVTNDLRHRVSEHKLKIIAGFTRRYNINKLVYHETFRDPVTAIAREKQIKNYSRKRKEALIEPMNPDWNDLPL
jgi:putative endonuclease